MKSCLPGGAIHPGGALTSRQCFSAEIPPLAAIESPSSWEAIIKPLLSLDEFETRHRDRDAMLKRYLASARGRRVVDTTVNQRLARCEAMSLFAVNTHSRIALARAADVTFRSLATALSKRKIDDAFFLTIAPRSMALSVDAASAFDHVRAIDWIKTTLGRRHYVGILEAGYYSNLGATGNQEGPTVSWHFHILTWGQTQTSVMEIIDNLNIHLPTLIPGRKMAHPRHLTHGRVVGRSMYMLKAPLKEYRVYPLKYEAIDQVTGEIASFPTGTFVTKWPDLRPGDSLRMCKVLGDRTLPDLLFSSGEGEKVLALMLRRASRRIRMADRAHTRMLREVTGLSR